MTPEQRAAEISKWMQSDVDPQEDALWTWTEVVNRIAAAIRDHAAEVSQQLNESRRETWEANRDFIEVGKQLDAARAGAAAIKEEIAELRQLYYAVCEQRNAALASTAGADPEWETKNERVVHWNKEQTRYLRAKLAGADLSRLRRLLQDIRTANKLSCVDFWFPYIDDALAAPTPPAGEGKP